MALPGIVKLSGTADGVKTLEASGLSNIENGTAMAPDALFQIASMTKAITSVAALRLVEAGKLSLHDPIRDVLPELAELRVLSGFGDDGKPMFAPASTPVTLAHLLTHTAGFGYEFMSAELNTALGDDRGAPGTLASLNTPLLFEPGTQWEYGISTDWAGRAVEAATGQTLGAVVAELVTGPLGMVDTTFQPTDAQRARGASLYARDEAGALMPMPLDFGGGRNAEFEPGGAGLWSSAEDYFRFLQLILNQGVHKGERLLSEETMRLLTSNQIGSLRAGAMGSIMPMMAHPYDPFPGMDCGWSMAFLINKEVGPYGRSAGSLAWAGIANCHYFIDLARGRAAIMLMQLLPFGDPEALDAFRAFEQGVSA
jgi:CubicO group peptidase (beta-lactamase class C family)